MSSGAIVCDDLPTQVVSCLSATGLQSPLSVASVASAGLISVAPLSFRSSQSFRVINSKQCIYEAAFDDDEETLQNIRTDGRVTLQFEVAPPTTPPSSVFPSAQLVKIQGTGLVYERGSSPYNAVFPILSPWSPRAIVSIQVQRVLISNAGPILAPPSPNYTTTSSRPSLREAAVWQSGVSSVNRQSASRMYQTEFGSPALGWPSSGDACCMT